MYFLGKCCTSPEYMSWREVIPNDTNIFLLAMIENERRRKENNTELTSFRNQIEHSFLGKSLYEPGLFHTNIKS